MKKIGLFYATKAERTSWVAEKIQKEFGEDKIEVVPIEQAGRMILLLMTASLWVLPPGLTGNFLLIGTNCCRNSEQ